MNPAKAAATRKRKKEGLKRATLSGGRMLLYRATVALCPPQVPQDVKRVVLASGVLVAYKSKAYVATARHYLDAVQPAQMTIIFASENSSKAKDLPTARLMQARLSPQTMGATPLNPLDVKPSSKLDDVALIEIDPAMVPKWCWQFDLGSDRQKTGPKAGQRLLMLGYPSIASMLEDTGRVNPESGVNQVDWGRIPVEKSVFAKRLENPENILLQGSLDERGFYPTHHFAVSYDPENMPERIEPEGLSGCGVWLEDLNTRASGLLVPEPKLLGIEVAKIESRKVLKVTRIECLLKLIEEKKTGDSPA